MTMALAPDEYQLHFFMLQARAGSTDSAMEVLMSYIGYPYLAEDLDLEKLQVVAAAAQAVVCHPTLLRTPFISLFSTVKGEQLTIAALCQPLMA